MINDDIKTFLKEHWKFIVSIIVCIAFLAVATSIYIHNERKDDKKPITIEYKDLGDSKKVQGKIGVDAGTAQEIVKEIQYIHDGKQDPTATYYVQAPTLEKAADNTSAAINKNDASLPAAATEKTDRTIVTANIDKQKVDVYKINLRDNHKVKFGALAVDNKAYPGIGYQAGKWEGNIFMKSNKKIKAGSILYTAFDW